MMSGDKRFNILVSNTYMYKSEMYNSMKFARSAQQLRLHYCLLLILILVSMSLIELIAYSQYISNIIIRNKGRIAIQKISILQKSEIRGVFFHEAIFAYPHDWETIADTLSQYGINMVVINLIGYTGGLRSEAEWVGAINAFHSKGIEVHVSWNVLGDMASGDEYASENHLGEKQNWNCPIKIRDLAVQTVQQALSYDIDGIMLDYIRFDTTDSCYCEHCRAAFEEWYQENYGEPVSDWTEFYPDGSKWNIFAEWRTIPINELVKLIHDTAKAIKPNIVISVAAWTLFANNPIYWKKYLAQDIAAWIKDGYIDFVAPMMYTKDLAELEDLIDSDVNYWMGGQPEGPIPLVAFLMNDMKADSPTPELFKAEVDLVRNKGLDGWIIWRYSGPGGELEGSPDITQYLEVVEMPEVFSIFDIKVIVNKTSATITWKTELPATSLVEYNTIPLFNASKEIWSDFYYWNITHIQGNVITNNQNVTEHDITLISLLSGTKYYFRVQSKGISGTATSKVMTFTIPGR